MPYSPLICPVQYSIPHVPLTTTIASRQLNVIHPSVGRDTWLDVWMPLIARDKTSSGNVVYISVQTDPFHVCLCTCVMCQLVYVCIRQYVSLCVLVPVCVCVCVLHVCI